MRWLRSTEVLIAGGIVACFVLLGWFDYSRRVRAVERFDTFSSYDFQRGGYQAWYDLLRREGIRAERYQRRPAYLGDSVATLIVANNAFDIFARQETGQNIGVYTPGDLERLTRWVKSGGRLVWLVDQATEIFTPETSIRQASRKLLGPEGEPALRLPFVSRSGRMGDAAVSIAPSPLTAGVRVLSGTSPLRIPFNASSWVTPLVADSRGSVAAWYRLGKGTVIVVTDETLFENGRLALRDNARLAFNLAAFGLRPGDTVAFEEWSHGYQTGDTWWTITPRPLRTAITIAGGALFLLLLGASWRFGPATRPPENIERTSEEYVTSMAALLKRGRATRTAVRELAQIALHDAARSAGLPDSAPASSIATRLRGSQAGDRRAEDLIALERLAGYEHPSDNELLRAARLSRVLRKDLTFNGAYALQPRRSPARRSA